LAEVQATLGHDDKCYALSGFMRFRICSRLAGVMRALPPQLSQVFCRNGRRDSTRPVARHVGQPVSVALFVTIAWTIAQKGASREVADGLHSA